MAFRSGMFSFVGKTFGLLQPALSTTSVLNVSQRCTLSTSYSALLFLNNSPSPGLSSSQSVKISNRDKLPFPQPVQTVCASHIQIRNYNSVLRPRLHCRGCYFVWRHGRKFVECSDTPSHKQMKKMVNRKLWREDYTRGNVRKAMMWNRDLARISDRMCDRDVLTHSWLASRIGKGV